MAKIAIVYVSVHHKNTEKLLKGIASSCDVDLFDLMLDKDLDLSDHDVIGYASGIFALKMHGSIYKFLDENKTLPKKAIAICTSGMGKGTMIRRFSKFLQEKGFEVLGEFECKGFDTFGPFKLIGGINRKHPDEKDIAEGIAFLKGIEQKL
ncbi:MAG: flavodoxin domain-containing protein [Peptostreptococcaceae bacterium]|nr:flavodoxin domain-containing protein [Peptostreptococcaceae bacterium]